MFLTGARTSLVDRSWGADIHFWLVRSGSAFSIRLVREKCNNIRFLYNRIVHTRRVLAHQRSRSRNNHDRCCDEPSDCQVG